MLDHFRHFRLLWRESARKQSKSIGAFVDYLVRLCEKRSIAWQAPRTALDLGPYDAFMFDAPCPQSEALHIRRDRRGCKTAQSTNEAQIQALPNFVVIAVFILRYRRSQSVPLHNRGKARCQNLGGPLAGLRGVPLVK